MAETSKSTIDIKQVITDILKTIDREREREIISRRFGLFDRKETLEQIGELLGITRERVRQLEKAVVIRLKTASDSKNLPHLEEMQKVLKEHLSAMGNVARIQDLSAKISKDNSRVDQARVSFLALLSPKLVVIDDNDNFYHSVGQSEFHNEKKLKDQVANIIDAISKIGEPVSIEAVAQTINSTDVNHLKALAGTSKHLASLNGRWGLIKWPMVNPKNIRDKIYVILKEQGKHMHLNVIAKAIKDSSFKRKDVTTQAIHNELIKDKRFILIGRGIYALKEWGYEKGTVADIITDVLKKAKEPLHRDEIVKRVLKSRYVKETTILLNLQGKQQFKRVAKATYTLAN